MKTQRLYHDDSHRLEFEATVVECIIVKGVDRGDDAGRVAVVLDQTAFYPTGGGQPHDTGTLGTETLGELRVEEVLSEDATDRVLHFLAGSIPGPAPLAPGTRVQGRVDAARRRDHLQQHTGQHILSQAFVQVGGIETRSFHLGADRTTIDVDPGVTDAIAARAVALANDVVFSDRPALVHHVTRDELHKFPLRKQTFDGERIRLIEIEGFDVSTCGGTHAHRTGEVGLIAITGWEKTKGLVRVEFVCGGRALRQLQEDRAIVEQTARLLSTGGDQVVAQVARLAESERAARKRAKQLFEIASEVEARTLLAQATALGTTRLVATVLADLSFDETQTLARKLVAGPGVVVLLGVPESPGAKLLFARSAEGTTAMGPLVKQVAERFGGRGGGSPAFAQAALPKVAELDAALAVARELLAATPAAGG